MDKTPVAERTTRAILSYGIARLAELSPGWVCVAAYGGLGGGFFMRSLWPHLDTPFSQHYLQAITIGLIRLTKRPRHGAADHVSKLK